MSENQMDDWDSLPFEKRAEMLREILGDGPLKELNVDAMSRLSSGRVEAVFLSMAKRAEELINESKMRVLARRKSHE